MTNDFLNQVSSAGAESLESLQELCEINARTAKKLAGLQLKLANLGVEGTLAQTRLLTGNSGYVDKVRAQPQLATDYGSRLFEIGCEAAAAWCESRDEMLAWMNRNGVQPAAAGGDVSPKGTRRSRTGARRRKAA